MVWPKIKNVLTSMRKEKGSSFYENVVWLAGREKEWKKEVWKPDLAWKFS